MADKTVPVDVLEIHDRLLREVPMGLGHMKNLVEARAAIAALIEAGKRMDRMHALLMAKTNHAASFYDAECFREMNEAPLQMQAALARVGGANPAETKPEPEVRRVEVIKNPDGPDFAAGERVYVKSPDDYFARVRDKVKDRDGVIRFYREGDRAYIVDFPAVGRRKPYTHHFYARDLAKVLP